MATRIRVLLVVSGLAVACAVAAVGHVATRSNDRVPAVSGDLAIGRTAVTDATPGVPDPANPAFLPKRSAQKTPANSTLRTDELPAAAALSPEQIAQAEAEKEARHVAEQKVIQAREIMTREFKLTPEQAAAAEPALASVEDLTRSMMALTIEGKVIAATLERQAKENGWTPEQTKQMRELANREFLAAHQGELLQCLDNATQVLEDFRPHLTAEQIPGLDSYLDGVRMMKERLLRGSFRPF